MTLETIIPDDLDRLSSTALARDSWRWITVLVDRSSSMEALRGAVVSGLNGFIAQHGSNPTVRLRIVEFGTDDAGGLELLLLYSSEQATTSETRALRVLDYRPRGGTPLLAAVMRTIGQLEPEVRPQDSALVVIHTDGQDNASPGISIDMLRARSDGKLREGNWTFAYLGAELDAWQTAQDMHIGALNSLNYATTPEGVRAAYKVTAESTGRWLARGSRKSLTGLGFFPLQLPPPQ